MKELTQQQKIFCNKYFETGDPTASAIYAGYSDKTATEQASRMLTRVNIKKYLQSLNQPITDRLGITKERVLTEIANIAFNPNEKNYVKLKALSELCKIVKLYEDNVVINVNNNQFENMSDEQLKEFIKNNVGDINE